jgi:hypothetical protein
MASTSTNLECIISFDVVHADVSRNFARSFCTSRPMAREGKEGRRVRDWSRSDVIHRHHHARDYLKKPWATSPIVLIAALPTLLFLVLTYNSSYF